MPDKPTRPTASSSDPPATPTKRQKLSQPRLASFFTSPSSTTSSTLQAQLDKDEELARRLQHEWNQSTTSQADASVQVAAADDHADQPRPESRPSASAGQADAAADDAERKPPTPPPSHPTPLAPLFRPKPAAAKVKAQEATQHVVHDETASRSKPATSTPKSSVAPPFDLEAMDAAIASIPLADDIFTFDPLAVDTSAWPCRPNSDGHQPTAPYALLARTFALLSATRSRLLITTILTNLLRVLYHHDAESLLPTVYLVSNHIAPPHDGVELGLGGSIVNRAIRDVTGKSPQLLRQLWNRTGDAGDVAYEAKRDVKALLRPSPITVQKLFATLHQIARLSGPGSSSSKLGHVTRLLVHARGEETRFLVRTFISHLRIQAVRTTITTVLARTFALEGGVEADSASGGVGNGAVGGATSTRTRTMRVSAEERRGILANPSKAKDKADPRRLAVMHKLARAERTVREVRARHPNFSSIVPALLEGGIDQLSQRVPLRVGTPLSPMLGSITRSLQDMHAKLGPRAFVSEFKYDGQRVQIHAVHLPVEGGDGADETTTTQNQARRRELRGAGKGKWVGRQRDVYVRLFSRHLEDMTDKYPDINDLLPLLMGVDDEEEGEAPAAVDGSNSVAPRKVRSLILDAEVVAMSPEGALLPFQTLANRSRKEVDLRSVKVSVGVFCFDVMYLDGEALLKRSFRARRRLLRERLAPMRPRNPLVARFEHVRSCEQTGPDEVEAFFREAREAKCEGIMVKSLDHHWETTSGVESAGGGSKNAANGETEANADDEDGALNASLQRLGDEVDDDIYQPDQDRADDEAELAAAGAAAPTGADQEEAAGGAVGKGVNGRGKALLSTYEPDKRCESWLKVKKDYVEGVGDSLDLVPIGAWHGMGRKAKWWSPVLLAAFEPDTAQYVAVCKCISGFTDQEYNSITFERFKEDGTSCYSARNEACRDEYDTGGLVPDVWFEPKEVWEVRGADITVSPVYPAALGLVSDERGLSLRFPRFLRRREDKSPQQATTPRQLAALYREQNHVVAVVGGDGDGDGEGDGDGSSSAWGERASGIDDASERGGGAEVGSPDEERPPSALGSDGEEI